MFKRLTWVHSECREVTGKNCVYFLKWDHNVMNITFLFCSLEMVEMSSYSGAWFNLTKSSESRIWGFNFTVVAYVWIKILSDLKWHTDRGFVLNMQRRYNSVDRPRRRWWMPAWQPRRAKTAGWIRTALSSTAALCSLCTCKGRRSPAQTQTGCCLHSLANTWGGEKERRYRTNTSHSPGCTYIPSFI